VDARLGREVVVHAGRQVDREVLEVLQAVAALLEGRVDRQATGAAHPATGVLLDVMGVHQGDDQEEGPVAVVGVEEVHRALAVQLAVGTGLAGRRAAAVDDAPVVVDLAATQVAEAGGVAHVGRVPVVEAVAFSEMGDVGVGPVVALLVVVVSNRAGEVELALEGDVVARSGHDPREVRQVAGQHRQVPLHLVLGVVAGDQVLDAVLGRVAPGHERGPACRAGGGVALGPGELQAVLQQPAAGRQVGLGPAGRQVHHLPLLIGDDQQDVGLARQVAEGHGIPRSVVLRMHARFASTRC
jgi:hypothetical protein